MTSTKSKLTITAALSLFAVASLQAVTVSSFSEDFEGDLSQWTGKSNGAHSGEIIEDPLNSSNHVLHFTSTTASGDIFSINSISTTGTYTVSFDYLGYTALGGSGNGGFVGISQSLPGTHQWIAGTGGYPTPFDLVDDNTWHHYDLTFSSTIGSIVHLIIEDWNGISGPNGDAYFDNINIRDSSVTPSVPDSGATAMLLGLGLLGMVTLRRKMSRN